MWLKQYEKRNEDKNNPYWIIQFIDALIKLWKKRKIYNFLAEGGELHYQYI